jgi:hypothetical protein
MQKKCKIKFVVLKQIMFLGNIGYDQPKKYALCIEIRALVMR